MVERPLALRLGILVFDGVMMSSVAAPSDALRVADQLALLRFGAGAPTFRSELIHARGATSVRTSGGMQLSGIVAPERDPDVLLLPGIMHGSAAELLAQCATLDVEIALLRAMHERGVRIAGCCTGSFLLAMSGLLDGRTATTSWWLAAAFRQAFPLVELQADALVVESGSVTTAGGATAVLDFVFRQIASRVDPELAQTGQVPAGRSRTPEPGAVRVRGTDREAALHARREDREVPRTADAPPARRRRNRRASRHQRAHPAAPFPDPPSSTVEPVTH
ncbi:MAG: DJ-1/PfpI family protein [Xanthomonadales bacterium]|nr:DJ-1/PfpI family protein [Xanthomonadales bacterium]